MRGSIQRLKPSEAPLGGFEWLVPTLFRSPDARNVG
jgi:hypothetical protein